ncbi:uncharacterized protein PFL1_04074 [Pseudozyma flocculosa PF-1]|uniref:DH domain-containing protein n=2 Tax=Pseudozyma flocculosa TaxID=84751 RepID=A0A5C3EV05_9BASI|nr:uncharacterized protein PFL1_04074 [Pseudozyma flocculosa PF-1]EPQ28247.1 hypothetical protein PFL1_04074 [Pseudozyma flocculosa PF-1]SPO35386.1 uncharacterized protein PSFLO_00857 [Pseudozyma flocculosa]
MTAATASSPIPAEIRFDPYPFASRSRLSLASTDFLSLDSAGEPPASAASVAVANPRAVPNSALQRSERRCCRSDRVKDGADKALDKGFRQAGPIPTDLISPTKASAASGSRIDTASASATLDCMRAPVTADETVVFREAGPSRLPRSSGTLGDDDLPVSPLSEDSSLVSPPASTPRATSPACSGPPSPKGKGRASEEELAALDADSLSHQHQQQQQQDVQQHGLMPGLPSSTTDDALTAQSAISQELTRPLLQALDEAHRDQLEVESILSLDPAPCQGGGPHMQNRWPPPASTPPLHEQPPGNSEDDSTPTRAATAQASAERHAVQRPTASRTASGSSSNLGSDSDFQDACEVLDGAGSAQLDAAAPIAQPATAVQPSSATASSEQHIAVAIAVAAAAVAEEDSNRPVSAAQPDISRTPSTSTTGSSHAGSVDTAISSSQSTAASSCPGCAEQSCDTLKITVDGEPSVNAAQDSPLSFVSEPEALSGLDIPSSAAATSDVDVAAERAADIAAATAMAASTTDATKQPSPGQQDKAVQAKVRRYAALLELVETERNYADDLATLVLVFFDNLYTMPFFEDQPARHALVIRNSEDLLRLHQRLSARMDGVMSELGLRKGGSSSTASGGGNGSAAGSSSLLAKSDLEKALSPQADEAVIRIARLFTGTAAALQGYKVFCSRHGEALALIREAEKRHADWDAFERRCSEILRMSRAPGYGPSRPPSGASTPGVSSTSSPASYFTPLHMSSNASSATTGGGSSSTGSNSAAATPGSVHSAIRQNSSRLLFRDFLIKPVQRLCLYPLVLQTLLKHTPAGAAGYEELSTAIAQMRQVADGVDEAGRRRELELMADLITSRVESHHGVSPSFIRSLGECRLAGTLDVLHHHRTLDPLVAPLRFKYLGVFLYDGFLLMVKVKKAPTYECRQWFPLWAARLSNVDEGSNLLPHSFRLSVRSHHFELAASNARERQVWIAALSDAISNASVSPPGAESSFPSSLFLGSSSLGDGSDSDGNPCSAGATPSASRGIGASSYWDVAKETVADPLMEFFAQHAAGSVAFAETAPPLPSSVASPTSTISTTATAASPSALHGIGGTGTGGSASVAPPAATATASSAAAAATTSGTVNWFPTEILLRHASPSSRGIVDRGMVFSDAVLNARHSRDAGDISSLWLPHNQTIGSAVGTAMGFGRLSGKDTSTVKIQRRKSCVGSLESAVAGGIAGLEDGQLLFTATVMQPGSSRARPSAKSIADFTVNGGIGGDSSWKASLRKKANKVRPPSIFAPAGLTVVTDDLTSPRSPRSAKSTPTSPVQSSRDLHPIEFGSMVGGVPPPADAFLQPSSAASPSKRRQGSEDASISATSSPRPSYTPSFHSGLGSTASSIVNLRSAAAEARRRSSIYGVRETLAASFGGRRGRTRSGQTDMTDLSADASSRGVSPMSSNVALHQLHGHGAVIDDADRPPLDALTSVLSASAHEGSSASGRLRSGSRPGSLRRALTSASFSTGRKRTQSDVGTVPGARADAASATSTAAAAAAAMTGRGRVTAGRLERTDSHVTMPVDDRRGSGGSVTGIKEGLSRRFGGSNGAAANAESRPTLGGSLRRSRTMLSSGRAWLGSLSAGSAPMPTAPATAGVERVHAGKTSNGSSVAAAAIVEQDGISPKSTPTVGMAPASRFPGGNGRPPATSTPASRPLSQCRSFTDPELAAKAEGGRPLSRGREVARSESAPAVPLVAKSSSSSLSSSDSPKRGSRMLNTLRFLQSNRLSPIPLKAVAETAVEHSVTGGEAASSGAAPDNAAGTSRLGASPVKGRTSLPARLSLLDNQAVDGTTGRKA